MTTGEKCGMRIREILLSFPEKSFVRLSRNREELFLTDYPLRGGNLPEALARLRENDFAVSPSGRLWAVRPLPGQIPGSDVPLPGMPEEEKLLSLWSLARLMQKSARETPDEDEAFLLLLLRAQAEKASRADPLGTARTLRAYMARAMRKTPGGGNVKTKRAAFLCGELYAACAEQGERTRRT